MHAKTIDCELEYTKSANMYELQLKQSPIFWQLLLDAVHGMRHNTKIACDHDVTYVHIRMCVCVRARARACAVSASVRASGSECVCTRLCLRVTVKVNGVRHEVSL